MKARRLGVCGGSFDPVHFGHLRPALEVAEELALDAVHMIPLHGAVHRRQPHASPQQRLAMLRAALRGQSLLRADDREIRRGGSSYMVDTLQSLRDEAPAAHLHLLLGADAFAGFASWREPERILALAHLVVMRRPGSSPVWPEAVARWLARRQVGDPAGLRERAAGGILFVDVTQLAISSTRIRERLRAGYSAAYLTPAAVSAMMEEQNLYREHGPAETG